MCPANSIFDQNVAPLFSKKLINESKIIDQYLDVIPYTRLSHTDLDEHSIEQLHQLRVHTRRLRTLLQYLTPVLDSRKTKKQLQQFYKAFRAKIKSTNIIRDQHVLQQRINTWSTQGNESVKVACIWLSAYIQNNDDISCLKSYNLQFKIPIHTRCAQGHDSLLDAHWLQSFHTLNNEFRATTKDLIKKKKINSNLAIVLGKTLDQLQTRADKEIDTWLEGNKESLHDLRITVKEFRYLLSPWRTHLNETSSLLVLLRSLQEVLGQIHDNHIQQLWLSKTIPKIAKLYYRQSCSWMKHDELASYNDFTQINPSPMEGLMLILSHLKEEERDLVQYMKQRLDADLKATLDEALQLLKIEIQYIDKQTNNENKAS